jgi:hypothetical protein
VIATLDCFSYTRGLALRAGLAVLLLMLVCGGVCPLTPSPAVAKEASTATKAKKAEPKTAEDEKAPSPKPVDDKDRAKDAPKEKDASKEKEAPKEPDGEKSKPPTKDDSATETPTEAEDEDEQAEVEIEYDEEEEEPEDAKSPEVKPPVAKEPKDKEPEVQKRVIGATATIMEKKSEILFRARIDTGAKSCSLHIADMKIENEAETMADNIGKVVNFHIVNGDEKDHWLEAKIASYVIIKTSNASTDRKRRYKVPLTFRWKDVEKTVLVTLNDREHMDFPLLLGRNFLSGDFVVDVELNNDD